MFTIDTDNLIAFPLLDKLATKFFITVIEWKCPPFVIPNGTTLFISVKHKECNYNIQKHYNMLKQRGNHILL